MNQAQQPGGLRCHNPYACAMGQKACPSPEACCCASNEAASTDESEKENAARHYGAMAVEARAACLQQSAEPMSEQDAGLLEQAASFLEALANDERNRGNSSTAEGAACSAHAVRRLAVQWLQAAPPAPSATPGWDEFGGDLEKRAQLVIRLENVNQGEQWCATSNHSARIVVSQPSAQEALRLALSDAGQAAPPAPAAAAVQDERRYWKMICAMPRYSFMLNDVGGVVRVQDSTGNWIDRDAAWGIVDSAEDTIAELRAALAAAPAQTSAGITIDFRQATELLAMFGGEPTEVTLIEGSGHSGEGVYAYYSDMPEEGAEFLGSHDDEAMPAAPAQEHATRELDRQAALQDSAYAAGMLTGWVLCVDGDHATFSSVRGERITGAARVFKAARAAAPAQAQEDTPEWPLPGDLVRYDSGSSALALHGEPHAGGWHGIQCMGGHTFYLRTERPTDVDRETWARCAVQYRRKSVDEARREAGLEPDAARAAQGSAA